MIDCSASHQVTGIFVKKERRLHMKRVSTESMKVLSDKKVYAGIDVHKESWHVTVRTDGEEGFTEACTVAGK